MAKLIAGTLHITVDGKELDITGAVTIPMAKTSKESIVSANGNIHYKELPIAPSIEGTFLVTEEFPVDELTEGTDMTIVARLANSKTYTLSEAFIEGDMNFESDGATVGIKFTGTNGRWS